MEPNKISEPMTNAVFYTLLLLILAACRPASNLRFETIEQGLYTGYQSEVPALYILTGSEELADISNYVGKEGYSELQKLDYGNYFVIAVFQGYKGSLDYGVTIKQISEMNHRIEVGVLFKEPNQNEEKHPIISSPYQVIKVERPKDFTGNFTFVLKAGENLVSTQEKTIQAP